MGVEVLKTVTIVCFHLQSGKITQGLLSLLIGCLFGIFIYPEDGGNAFLQNFNQRLPGNMTSRTRSYLHVHPMRTSNPISVSLQPFVGPLPLFSGF
jgi:hypothetical protein